MSEVTICQASQPEDVLAVTRILREGGVAVIPTDTVYGLAASIFQPDAIKKIYEIKRRSTDVAVPVLMASAADLPLLVNEVPTIAWTVIDTFWPGPLTLVLGARPNLDSQLIGDENTVGVRVPGSRACLALLQALGEPVVGTSANISGAPPANTAAEARERLGDQVDAILEDDTGIAPGQASTVLQLSHRDAAILRVGAIGLEEIRHTLGTKARIQHHLTNSQTGANIDQSIDKGKDGEE